MESTFEMPSGLIRTAHLFCGTPVTSHMTSKGPVPSPYCETHRRLCLMIRVGHTERQTAIFAEETKVKQSA